MPFGNVFDDMEKGDRSRYNDWASKIKDWITGDKDHESAGAYITELTSGNDQGGTDEGSIAQQALANMLARTGGYDVLNPGYIKNLLSNAANIASQWEMQMRLNGKSESMDQGLPAYFQNWFGSTQGNGYGWGAWNSDQWRGAISGLEQKLQDYQNTYGQGSTAHASPEEQALYGDLDPEVFGQWLQQAYGQMYSPLSSRGMETRLNYFLQQYQHNKTKDWNSFFKELQDSGLL